MYHSGDPVLVDALNQIICICEDQNGPYLVLREHVSSYDPLLGAFRCAPFRTVQQTRFNELRDLQPLGMYSVLNAVLCVPRHFAPGLEVF